MSKNSLDRGKIKVLLLEGIHPTRRRLTGPRQASLALKRVLEAVPGTIRTRLLY